MFNIFNEYAAHSVLQAVTIFSLILSVCLC